MDRDARDVGGDVDEGVLDAVVGWSLKTHLRRGSWRKRSRGELLQKSHTESGDGVGRAARGLSIPARV